MQEAFVYLATLSLFSFVVIASARMQHDMLLLTCIPPVFVALVVGFIMALYAGDAFGVLPTGLALLIGGPFGWWLGGRLKSRDLLISIYLAWALAMLLALIAFAFPDRV